MTTTHRLPLTLSSLLVAGALSLGCATDDGSMSGGGKADDLEGRDRDAACEIAASSIADADIDDLNHVLEVATTLDVPAMTIEKFELSGCDDIVGSAQGRERLAQRIADLAYDRSATDFPEALVFSDLEAGGVDFKDMVDEAVQVIGERIDDGLWEPSDDPAGEEIWSRIDEVTEAIVAPIDGIGYHEQSVGFDNAECPEDAIGLYSGYDDTLVLIHQLPRC